MSDVRRCVAVLGGSFDPVHSGHVALGKHFATLLQADELRILPAGNPWQKAPLRTDAAHRVAMISCAFDTVGVPVTIDQQEIQRHTATYTVDTLKSLREELGPDTAIAFLLGADQLQHLNTWHNWQQLFDYAHLCAAARPGFALDAGHIPAEVAAEFAQRLVETDKIRSRPAGLTCIAADLDVDVSATAIRSALERGEQPAGLPSAVLHYIHTHQLYKN
ncbi:MAG TPA: nicotinate-nucleotide adenylyltransferase [Burkholderiaceae bacterium]